MTWHAYACTHTRMHARACTHTHTITVCTVSWLIPLVGNSTNNAEFEVFTALVVKIWAFWDMTLCQLKMRTASSYKMQVSNYQLASHHIPKDMNLQPNRQCTYCDHVLTEWTKSTAKEYGSCSDLGSLQMVAKIASDPWYSNFKFLV
jgi:hypothetical protein